MKQPNQIHPKKKKKKTQQLQNFKAICKYFKNKSYRNLDV